MQPPSRPLHHWRVLAILTLALSCFVLWQTSLHDPLYPPDEGRYSAASVAMAEGGSWLVPVLDGKPHLTKPPVAYWCQAICLRMFGHTEIAVRTPSLLASSLLAVLVLCTGWRTGGPRLGILATAIVSIMPLQVAVGRLAITDPLLNLLWFATLVSGYVAVQNNRIGWPVTMWIAVALGLMTKGPLALVPLGIIIIWLGLGRQWSSIRKLRPIIGLPLALTPLAIWAISIWRTQPDAISIWRKQIVSRVVGTGDHNEPFWYYVPIFLGGVFPATAMIFLPGLNTTWRAAWQRCRTTDATSLWIIATIVPLIMFSVMSGKLPSYLLPLCAPMALIGAGTLKRWLSDLLTAESHSRLPEIVATSTIVAAAIAIGALVLAFRFHAPEKWMVAPIALPACCCAWMWLIWKQRPHLRARAYACVFIATSFAWFWGFQLFQSIRKPLSAQALVQHLRETTGIQSPRILIYGFRDPTIGFYSRQPVMAVEQEEDALTALRDQPERVVLLIDENDRGHFAETNPNAEQAFVQVGESRLWASRKIAIMRPRQDETH